MGRAILANFIYVSILIFMVSSALWVLTDARRRGKPWSETLAWALFVGGFFGLGLIVYILWNKKFKS